MAASPWGIQGFLDGKAVATHWQDAPLLAEHSPKLALNWIASICAIGNGDVGRRNGRHRPIACSGGGRSWQDVALRVAKRLVVVTQRQSGQLQFSPYLTVPGDDTCLVATLPDNGAHSRKLHGQAAG